MLTKLKAWFKLNNWKRITILALSFVAIILFVGLSFGLYSKKSTVTTEYKNGIQVSVKPTNEDATAVDDPLYNNQIFTNTSARLEEHFPDKNFTFAREANGVFTIKVTNVNTAAERTELLDYLVQKSQLVITSLDHKYGSDPFYDKDKDTAKLFVGTSNQPTDNSYSLSFQKGAGDNYSSNEVYTAGKQHKVDKVILWKNFDKLQEIVENDLATGVDNISDGKYQGEYYRYLFWNGLAPETDKDSAPPSDDPNAPTPEKFYFFKKVLKDREGKEYKPTDFLLTINPLDDYKNTATLNVSKEFQAANFKGDATALKKEFLDIQYWLNDYSLDNYLVSFINAARGPFAYWIFTTTVVSFFAILSIFAVLNYGYLGIIALLLLAVIVFLALAFLTAFIGDYDTITTAALLFSTLIAFDCITLFCEKVKREVAKGHSIPKALKTTIKVTNRGDYTKFAVLLLGLVTIFSFTTRFDPGFALLTVATLIFIPLVMLLGLRLLAKVFIGLRAVENNGRTVGFWKNDVEIKREEGEEETGQHLLEQIAFEQADQAKITTSKWFHHFQRVSAKGGLISLATFATLLVAAIAVFLGLFLSTPTGGFRLAPSIQEQIVLRIGGNDHDLDPSQVSAIKQVLINEGGISPEQIVVQNGTLLEVYLAKTFSNADLNKLTSTLISMYNVRIIQSQLINSQTFFVMKFALAAIVLALVTMCIFVLFWMKWTKALSFLVVAAVAVISFILILMLGLVELSPLVAVLATMCFLIFSLTTLNALVKFNEKLKTKRTAEMDHQTIRQLLDVVSFKNLRPTLITHGLFVGTFALFTIAWGALPWSLTLFLICFSLTNFVFSFFLLPLVLGGLETLRARTMRKHILNRYWETEKVHEQVFSGINNLK